MLGLSKAYTKGMAVSTSVSQSPQSGSPQSLNACKAAWFLQGKLQEQATLIEAKENLKAQSRSTTSSSILDKLEPRKTKSEKGGVATTGDEDMDKMDDINTDVDVDVAEVVDIVGYKRRSYNNGMSQDVWAMLRRRRPCSPSPPWPAHPPGPRP
jgi:hypothetical protein